MSFFLKGKPKLDRKRKFPKDRTKLDKTKLGTTSKAASAAAADEHSDEEIESEDEEELNNGTNIGAIQFSDEEEIQTPQDKRLRLAKKYLEEIEKEEQSRAEDNEVHTSVSQRLTDEYLDSVGKLRRKVADEYVGYASESLQNLKHKLQKLPITCICLSSDSKVLFSGSKTNFVIKWNLSDLKPAGSIDCTKAKSPLNHGNDRKNRPQIQALALSTDFRFLAMATMDKCIQIWCPNTLESLHTFQGHRDIVTALVFRKDSHQLYSTSRDRSLKVWSLDEMTYIETLFGHQSPITDIDALSRERAITSGGFDCSIRIWKLAEESQLIYNGHKGNIENVRLINEENFLSSGSDGSLCVWSAMKKKPLCTKELAHGSDENGEPNWISSIATLLNTDIVASGASDSSIKVWKLGDNFRSITLLFNISIVGFVNSLIFTADGNQLIAAVGQEHRLGRWWRIKEAKNHIVIVPFERNKIL